MTDSPSLRKIAEAATQGTAAMTDDQINHMVNRFLGWKLPENFSPDDGISFKPEFNVEHNAKLGKPPQRHEPSGTNLFDATQATEMVRYMVEGLDQQNAATIERLEREVAKLRRLLSTPTTEA